MDKAIIENEKIIRRSAMMIIEKYKKRTAAPEHSEALYDILLEEFPSILKLNNEFKDQMLAYYKTNYEKLIHAMPAPRPILISTIEGEHGKAEDINIVHVDLHTHTEKGSNE